METSLDEMYADIKALVSRWEEDVARLVNRWLDEDRANGIKTLADLKKRYGKQIRLSKKKEHKGNKNNGNVEIEPIGSENAAFLLVAMMGSKCSSRILEYLDDDKKEILDFETGIMSARITDLKGTIIKEEIDSLLKLHSIIELMGAEGNIDDERNYLWERMGYLFRRIKCEYELERRNYKPYSK